MEIPSDRVDKGPSPRCPYEIWKSAAIEAISSQSFALKGVLQSHDKINGDRNGAVQSTNPVIPQWPLMDDNRTAKRSRSALHYRTQKPKGHVALSQRDEAMRCSMDPSSTTRTLADTPCLAWVAPILALRVDSCERCKTNATSLECEKKKKALPGLPDGWDAGGASTWPDLTF